MSKKLILLAAALLFASATWAQFMEGLFSPKINVQIQHAPALPLTAERIVFGSTSDSCAGELVHAAATSLSQAGIEVIDRQNLDFMPKEKNLILGDEITASRAAVLSEALGPSVLITIKVPRCEHEQKRTYSDVQLYNNETERNETHRLYKSTTMFFFRAIVQITELKTTRTFPTQPLELNPSESNESYSGYPEFPHHFKVRDQVIADAATQVTRMFVPWHEVRKVTFYKNKKCNLRAAFNALKASQYNRVVELAEKSVVDCGDNFSVSAKVRSQVLYNAGMANFIVGDYDKALAFFEDAYRERPGNIASQAIDTTMTALGEKVELESLAEQAAAVRVEEYDRIREKESKILTNASIIELTTRKLPNAVIASLIKTSDCQFDLSPEALGMLVEQGVHEDVIVAMVTKAGG